MLIYQKEQLIKRQFCLVKTRDCQTRPDQTITYKFDHMVNIDSRVLMIKLILIIILRCSRFFPRCGLARWGELGFE